MLFNSLAFAVFLPVVCLLHWALPNKYRWALLLAASYYFYMSWNAAYIALILLTTAVSYGAALWIERLPARRGRRAVLIGALVVVALLRHWYLPLFEQLTDRYEPASVVPAILVAVAIFALTTVLNYVAINRKVQAIWHLHE